MPNTTINVDFPEYKLKAIEQALKDKPEPKTVQEMLAAHVEGLYQKNVPAPARKYLDSIIGETQESAPEQSTPAQDVGPQQRRPYRRRENAMQQEGPESIAPEQPELEQTETEPEQEPGMNMSM